MSNTEWFLFIIIFQLTFLTLKVIDLKAILRDIRRNTKKQDW